MSQSAFSRAKQLADGFPRWSLKIVGLASAVSVPLLIIVICNMTQLMVGRSDPVRSHTGLAGYLNAVDRTVAAEVEEAPKPDTYLELWQGGIGKFPLSIGFTILVALAAAFALVEIIALWLLHRLVVSAALSMGAKLKMAIYKQINRIGASEPLGGARSRPEVLFVDQVEKVESGVMQYWKAVPRSITLLLALLTLAIMADLWMAILAILLGVMIWIVFNWLRNQQEETRVQADRAAAQLEKKLLEDLRLAPLVVSYGMQDPPGDPHEVTINRQRAARRATALSKLTPSPLLMLVVAVAAGVMLFVVGWAERMDLFHTTMLAGALAAAYFPAIRLYRLWRELGETRAAASDIFKFLDREVSVVQMPTAQPMQPVTQSVALDKVTLASVSGDRLLREVSLNIPAITNVGFISTDAQTPKALAGLLLRYYDPAAGRILFDTHDLRNATLDSIQSVAGYAPVDGPLFTGTVTENLTCGDARFTEPDVAEVTRKVGAYDMIQKLPDNFATIIGEGGRPLDDIASFQISLSRAMLRDPSLLIVEEPSDGGDPSNGQAIDLALRQASADRTLVVLPSRIQTLRLLDQVFFFHEGALRGSNTHAELIKNDELYRHIIYLKFNNVETERQGASR